MNSTTERIFMPSHLPPAHAQPVLRRGPAFLTFVAVIILLVAALGGLGVISVPDAAGSVASGDAPAGTTHTATTPRSPSTPGATTPSQVASTPVAGTTTPAAGVGDGTTTGGAGAVVAARPDGFRLALGSFFDALAEPAEDAPTSAPVVPTVGQTTAPPVADTTALPASSGSGKRVVYAITAQRVWLVEADGTISRTYRVSGRLDRPGPGSYAVYSRSLNAVSYNYTERMKYMVRFTHGANAAIGFHNIPIDQAGNDVQTLAQLGQPLSAGCIRQSEDDAIALWNWAPDGTTVVVVA